MKSENYDILARCLAADDHPHLLEEPEFQEAVAEVEASPELQESLKEARDFVSSYPVLVEAGPMPSDVRERISQAIQENESRRQPEGKVILGPWQIRSQFAWAACLVLLLGAISLYSSYFLENRATEQHHIALAQLPPQDAFRSEVGRLVTRRFSLQEKSDSATHLVSWLGGQGVDDVQIPSALPEQEVLGCSQFEAPFGKIGVVCFDVNGEVVHMFMACSQAMGLEEVQVPSQFRMQGRPAVQWSDEENLYLMIPDQPDTELPEIFL